MTKRSEKTSPNMPGSNDRTLAKVYGTGKEKRFSEFNTVDVFAFEKRGEMVGLGLMLDGEPHILYTHAYQNIEMTSSHADYLLKRLEYGKHYISFNFNEIKENKGRFNGALNHLHNASVYHFLTREGTNRLFVEVDTTGMKDREVAENIEKRKDEMVNIFTRYESGETLSLKGETPNAFPKLRAPGAGILRDRLRQAQTYMKYTGCSKKEATLICLKMADEDHKRLGGSGYEALIAKTQSMPNDMKHLPPAQPGLYVSVTKIGKILGVTGQAVNRCLDKLGYQESAGSDHTPTDIGIPYAKWEQITISKNDGNQIVKPHLIWSVEIIDILRVHLEAEQATLPGCEST